MDTKTLLIGSAGLALGIFVAKVFSSVEGVMQTVEEQRSAVGAPPCVSYGGCVQPLQIGYLPPTWYF